MQGTERCCPSKVRYTIQKSVRVFLVLKSRFRVKSLGTFARGTVRPLRPPPLPNASLATLLTITLLPVSNLAEATRTNYMHLVVLYSIYPQYGTLLAIVVMVSVKFLPSAEPLER